MASMASKETLFSDLPINLLELIVFEKLGRVEDVLSCAKVCVSWRSAIRSRRFFKLKKPLLMLIDRKASPNYGEKPPSRQRLYLFDTETKKSHVIRMRRKLAKQWFHNCSNGWLLGIGSNFPHATYFLNPPTLSEIQLPSLGKQFQESFRVISSSSPSDPKCVVLGLGFLNRYTTIKQAPNRMIFCHPRDSAWKNVVLDRDYGLVIWHDVILHKNQFYAVSDEFLYRISFDGHAEKLIPLPPNGAAILKERATNCYLLDFNGDLVLVVWRLCEKSRNPDFKAYKMKFDDVHKIWIEMQSFGENDVYLQPASSVAVRNPYWCYYGGFRSNSLFCFGNHWNGGYNVSHIEMTGTPSRIWRSYPIGYPIPESTTATEWITHYEFPTKHKSREARLAVAKELRKAAERVKLEKEDAVANQKAIMEKVVEESETLQQEAEENTKLREFRMDRGHVVDTSVIIKDIRSLKENFDDGVPPSRLISSSQTSCILASSRSSTKSITASADQNERTNESWASSVDSQNSA